MFDSTQRSFHRPAVIAGGLAVFTVYLAAMAPGIFWRDSMEFCLLGHQLDIGHPAGSPTFSLLSKALSFLPLASLAWRANLLSVLGALAAVFLLYRAAVAWLETLRFAAPVPARLFGAVAALGFAFSPAFWSWSEVAEVYSLQAAVLAGLLWMAALAYQAADDYRWPAAIGLLLGLSCGIHMVQILYAPAFGLALCVGSRWRLRWRGLLLMIGFFFLGFAVFAYLPVRSSTGLPYDYGNPETWDAFLAQITGRKYSGVIHHFPWQRIGFDLKSLFSHFWDQLNPVLAVGALIGLGVLAARAPRLALLVILIFFGHLYLYIKDWYRAFGYIPLFLLEALLGGLGLARLGQWATRRGKSGAAGLIAAAALLSAGVAVWGVGRNWAECDRHTHDLAQRHGNGVLASLPTGAILVGFQDALAYNMFYQQLIEKWRPDVRFIHRVWLAYPDELARRFPALRLADYDPNRPGDAQRMLLASAGPGGVYWDYGWETQPLIEPANLTPHGVIYRLAAEPWDGVQTAADRDLWRKYFLTVLNSPLVAPRGYDWTAQEIYSRAFHLRAKLQVDARRWPAAEAEAKLALHIRPDFAEYHSFLGLVYLAEKQYENALAEMDEALQLDSLCAPCYYYRGQLHAALKDRQGSLADYRRSFALQPANLDLAISLAHAYLINGMPAEALSVLAQHRRGNLNRRQWVENLVLTAATYRQLNRCGDVAATLYQLRRLEPGHPAIKRFGQDCGLPVEPTTTEGK